MNIYDAGVKCAAAYPPAPQGAFLQVFVSDTVTVGYYLDGEIARFSFAGTRDARDVLDDVLALPVFVPGIGHVHYGFYLGMLTMFNEHLAPLCRGRTVSAEGHSMGCSHASIFAALCARYSIPVDTLVLLEPPRPGYADFAAVVRGHVQHGLAFRNARSPVTSLPAPLPFFRWAHIYGLIELDAPAAGLDPINDHLLTAVLPGLKRWQDAQT